MSINPPSNALSEIIGAHSRSSSLSNNNLSNRAATPPKRPPMLQKNSNGMSSHNLLSNSKNKSTINMPPLRSLVNSFQNSPNKQNDLSSLKEKENYSYTEIQSLSSQRRDYQQYSDNKFPTFVQQLSSSRLFSCENAQRNPLQCLSIKENKLEIKWKDETDCKEKQIQRFKVQDDSIVLFDEEGCSSKQAFSRNKDNQEMKINSMQPQLHSQAEQHQKQDSSLLSSSRKDCNKLQNMYNRDANTSSREISIPRNKDSLNLRNMAEARSQSKARKQMEEEISRLNFELKEKQKLDEQFKEMIEQKREEHKIIVSDLEQTVKSQVNQISILKEQNKQDSIKIDSLKMKIEQLQSDIKAVHCDATKQENTNNGMKQRFDQLVKINNGLIEKNNQYQNELNKLETVNQTLNSQNVQLSDHVDNLKQQINIKAQQVDYIKSEISLLYKEIENNKKQNVTLNQEINALKEENINLTEMREEEVEQNNNIQNQFLLLQQENTKIMMQNQDLENQIIEYSNQPQIQQQKSIEKLEKSFNRSQYEEDKKNLIQEIVELKKKLEETQQKLQQQEVENACRQRENEDYRDKENNKKENDRLKWVIAEQAQTIIHINKQNQQLLAKYQKYKNKCTTETSTKEQNSLQALSDKLESKEHSIQEKIQEIQFWKSKAENYQKDFSELEQRLQAQLKSNQSLNDQLQKMSQIGGQFGDASSKIKYHNTPLDISKELIDKQSNNSYNKSIEYKRSSLASSLREELSPYQVLLQSNNNLKQ